MVLLHGASTLEYLPGYCDYFIFYFISFHFTLFYLIERGWEGEEEGEKHGCERETTVCLMQALVLGTQPTAQACALTRNGTGDLSVCRTPPIQLSHASPGDSDSFFFFFLRFYLFIFRERGREGEREGNINMWLPLVCPPLGTRPATQACALTGNQTGDPLVCKPALNPLSHTSQGYSDSFKELTGCLEEAILRRIG